MQRSLPAVSRRGLLRSAAVLGGAVACRSQAVASADSAAVSFFVIGDTHYLADATDPDRVDEASAAMTGGLIDTLNGLVGTEIPESAGGGVVRRPCGVLHVGDVIDTGDKQGGETGRMQRTEIDAFERTMGLTGGDAALDFPIYEVHGNHDGPQSVGVAIDRIVERNVRRPGVVRVSDDGLHYSWDAGDVHFVHLGIVVGQVPGIGRRRRYAPRGSLDFLVDDLRESVGTSARPVVLAHHIDIARYTVPVPAEAPFADKEWDPADVAGFHEALAGYRIAAIFHGHTHARSVWRWDGVAVRPGGEDLGGADGEGDGGGRIYDVFNCDNSSHFGGPSQAFFHVELGPEGLVVREYATRDGWRTGAWSPLVWRREGVAVAAG